MLLFLLHLLLQLHYMLCDHLLIIKRFINQCIYCMIIFDLVEFILGTDLGILFLLYAKMSLQKSFLLESEDATKAVKFSAGCKV